MAADTSRRMPAARLMAKLVLSSHAVAIAALLGASCIASTSALAVEQAARDAVPLTVRHGEDEQGEGHMDMAAEQTVQSNTNSSGNDEKGESHSHNHGMHGPSMYDLIPDALLQTSDTFIAVPPRPSHKGGHSHGGHGAQEPQLELNETAIVRAKGPDPLSYIEWDFAYGIGKTNDLLRFSRAYKHGKQNVMGVAGRRWRTLVDEKDESKRISIANDVQQRVESGGDQPGRHQTLLLLHVFGCILSCFFALPIVLALRAAESNLAPLASLVYLILLASSLFMSQLYKALTPRLYPSNTHGGLGYAIFWISLVVLGGDVVRLLIQMARIMRSVQGRARKINLKTFMQATSLPSRRNMDSHVGPGEEEQRLSPNNGGRHAEKSEKGQGKQSQPAHHHHVHFAQEEQDQEAWSLNQGSSRQGSSSDVMPSPSSTLCSSSRSSLFGEQQLPSMAWKLSTLSGFAKDEQVSSWRRSDNTQHRKWTTKQGEQRKRSAGQRLQTILRYSLVTVARSLPVLSFAAAYTGLAVYTGSCRGSYGNTCLAHAIKGGIFFWYGLFTFARYLGAYADMGWAWNRQPSSSKGGDSNTVSAEWVECLVIFIYGSTNTWMERFGASAGDPYSVKQVQHISIAVMFWFAGLMGLILETKSFRKLLALPVALKQASEEDTDGRRGGESVRAMTCQEAFDSPKQPPSYSFSFNPFPALVIGVTGVAMAAHHQDYVYQVSIHSLWGNLLAAFSIFRILTYFFLWLRPPTSSIMPSRPPTEALASFCLSSGGLVFMLSSEEVSFVAMRNGFGDFMMILNVTVALVCFVFCSIAGLMILKALALHRERQRQEEEAAQPEMHRPVFVLEEEEDDEDAAQDEMRQMSSSPGAI